MSSSSLIILIPGLVAYLMVGALDVRAFEETNWPASQDTWTPPWWSYLPGGGFMARRKWGRWTGRAS